MHFRTKRVLLGSITNFGARFLGFATQIGILSLFRRNLSDGEFGLFSVVTSMALIVGMLDFGITGHGLRNRLADMAAQKNRDEGEEKRQFLSVFYLSLGIFLFFSLAFLGVIEHLPLSTLFAFESPQQLPWVFSIAGTFTLMRGAFVVYTNGFFAYQETHLRSICEIAEFIILSISCLMGIVCKLTLIPLLTLYFSAFFIGPVFSLIALLKRRRWTLEWIPFSNMRAYVRPILSTSIFFWLYHSSSMAFFAVQPILIGHFIGLKEAGDFTLIQKCFTLFLGVHFALLTPLWSAVTNASSTGEFVWIKKALQKTAGFTSLICFVGIPLMFVLFEPVVWLWTGRAIDLSQEVYLMGLLTMLFAWINCLSVFISGLNKVRRQTFFATGGLIASIAFSTLFPHALLTIFTLCTIPLLLSNILEMKKYLGDVKQLYIPNV